MHAKLTSEDVSQASNILDSVRRTRPHNKQDLQKYLRIFLNLNVPGRSICPDHNSPLDYVKAAFLGDFSATAAGDLTVWANRGGGKTMLAAAVTLLDCVFKPGCQVRILGGSLQQSARMYDYLTTFAASGFESFLNGPIRKTACSFVNGSRAEILAQSATAVRGAHVHKLRCDELELFDPEVLRAAGFVTMSSPSIRGSIELISTMHRPYGIMRDAITRAAKAGTPVFKWCLWEVIENCRDRSCSRCPLSDDCRGKAKRAAGYFRIDDAIDQLRRSSRAGWESEMLCLRPSLDDVVFADFDPDVHIVPLDYDPDLPLYRAIDFGFVNPFVCLYIQPDRDGRIRVIAEYVRTRASIEANARQMCSLTPCREEEVAATYCDPAGAGRNDVTGTSAVKELRRLGIRLNYRRSSILEGIELIRRAMCDGSGRSSLLISTSCSALIESLGCYHYPAQSHSPAKPELPLKDGIYDHTIDALRYFFVNYTSSAYICRSY